MERVARMFGTMASLVVKAALGRLRPAPLVDGVVSAAGARGLPSRDCAMTTKALRNSWLSSEERIFLVRLRGPAKMLVAGCLFTQPPVSLALNPPPLLLRAMCDFCGAPMVAEEPFLPAANAFRIALTGILGGMQSCISSNRCFKQTRRSHRSQTKLPLNVSCSRQPGAGHRGRSCA